MATSPPSSSSSSSAASASPASSSSAASSSESPREETKTPSSAPLLSPEAHAERGGKMIYFIRHAESQHNSFLKQCSTWAFCQCWCWYHRKELVDAALSPLGKLQVKQLAKAVRESGLLSKIELVVVSPLSRALETSEVFQGHNIPFLVSAHAREARHNACDVGKSPDELKERWPELDFSKLVAPVWWYDPAAIEAQLDHAENGGRSTTTSSRKIKLTEGGIVREPDYEVCQRAKALLDLLRDQKAQHIAVVGHQNIFARLTGKSLKNTEIYAVPLDDLRNPVPGCM